MPIFDYRCRECGEVFEVLASPAEQVSCAKCGGNQVEKLLSSPGRVGISAEGGALKCGKQTTCCGSSTPCDKPPCGK